MPQYTVRKNRESSIQIEADSLNDAVERAANTVDDEWDHADSSYEAEHDPAECGCKYLGNNAWTCGHIDGDEDGLILAPERSPE
jgi:hypothetical protein